MSTNEAYKQRTIDALNRYFSKGNCPVCGLQHWNGATHPYSGTFTPSRDDQVWCNGKVSFKSGQEKKKES